MRQLLLFIGCLVLSPNLIGQCFDFSGYSQPYLDSVINDDVAFPVGEPFMSSGSIDLIKTDNLMSVIGTQGDTALCYIGDIIISVEDASNPKTLSFNSTYTPMVIVDNDTIFYNLDPPANYSSGLIDFYFDPVNGPSDGFYEISGDFDEVKIVGSTNCIWDICLSAEPLESCFDFSGYSQPYLDSVINDDVAFPVGEPFMSSGSIDLIKTDNLMSVIGTQGDTALCYIGDIIISVEDASNPKTLSFNSTYTPMVIVDNDTIFYNLDPPANYSSGLIDFYFDPVNGPSDGFYEISGDFDEVKIVGSTNCIWDICLSAEPLESCFDFSGYSQPYLDSVINDDVAFPVGEPFMSSGSIDLIKTDNLMSVIGTQGDTALCYIGDIIISVEDASNPKTLSFNSTYTPMVIVDNDTIFYNLDPPANYSSGLIDFYFDPINGPSDGFYEISGDFDVVKIVGSTNCIWDICLSANSLSVEEESNVSVNPVIDIYPNPVRGSESLNINSETKIEKVVVQDIRGKILYSTNVKSMSHSFVMNNRSTSSFIFVSVLTEQKWIHKKIIVL